MKTFATTLLIASATLAGCVAVPYDAGPPPPQARSNYGGGNGDRDRDGVPNKYDRDRDNDRTPNRYDRQPNNPYRQ